MAGTSCAEIRLRCRGAPDEGEGRQIVVVLGELATYLCWPGDIRPFAEEKPIPADLLGGAPTTDGQPVAETNKTRRQETSYLFLVSRLRRHLSDRNTILILPSHSSKEYRESVVVFCFEKLHVRTIIVLSDLVADSFGAGCRRALVLHASPSMISVGCVESGVTVRHKAVTYGSKISFLNDEVGNEEKGGLAQPQLVMETNEGRVAFRSGSNSSGAAEDLLKHLSAVESDCLGSSSPDAANEVDLLDEAYRDALVYLVGEDAYHRVVSLIQSDAVTDRGALPALKRSRVEGGDNSEASLSGVNGTISAAGSGLMTECKGREVEREEGALSRAISYVADGEPLPVIVAGEVFRVAPLLSKFIEDAVRTCRVQRESCAKQRSTTSTDEPLSSSTSLENTSTNSCTSSSSESSQPTLCDRNIPLQLQPLPIKELPWELALLGGSLVSQLSLLELCKLRISKDDALSSRGSVVHWRSVA
uniref:WGS project CAEQ00000000 data, annotated contig 808 n=1 Tax=Trypanosoma congolense (strain IL3000) TaxID=1068625 RepID=F9WIK9_TRYCI|nr:unnamed protein product [Trypanosoma congolense IL3000]